MNTDSLRYAFRRISNFKFEDVTQRLNLMFRHYMLKKAVHNSPGAFSVATLAVNRSEWLDNSINTSELRTAILCACRERLGCLEIGSQQTWDRFLNKYPSQSAWIMDQGRSLLAGKTTIFGGMEVDIGLRPDWMSCFDPYDAEKKWPNNFYWQMDFSRLNGQMAPDVKLNWEVNRLQFFLKLGACYRMSGDKNYGVFARSLLDSWIHTAQYPCGPQWSSNLEVAVRALSIVKCCLIFSDCEVWDDEFLLNVIASVERHMDHLENELTLHHTLGNHLLGESAALLQVSLLCPFLKGSSRRIERASGILNRLIPELILPDGVYAEQSSSYAKFVLEFLVPLLTPASRPYVNLNDPCRALIRKCLYFLMEISDVDGIVPMIGDSDSGSAIGLYLDDYWDVKPLMASGSFVFQDPGLMAKVRDFPAEAFLQWGNGGLEWFNSVRKSHGCRMAPCPETHPSIVQFPYGGLIKAEYEPWKVIFDVGTLGKPPGFEHGHSDGLSVQLWLHNKPILVDPGTFVYNANPNWRKYFKGSSAHNVMQFNDCDQSRSLGSFRWAYSPEISDVHLSGDDEHFCLTGSVSLEKANWERRIFNINSSVIAIYDKMKCGAEGSVGLNLIFDPSLRIMTQSEEIREHFSPIADLVVLGWPRDDVRLLYEYEMRLGGWFSKLYGRVEGTCNLRAKIQRSRSFSSLILIGTNPMNLIGKFDFEKIGILKEAQVDLPDLNRLTHLIDYRDSGPLISRFRLVRV